MKIKWLTCAVVTAILILGCGEEQPTKPGTVVTDRLAGGGQQSGDDSFHGGPGESGPRNAVTDTIVGYGPIFYSDIACGEAPRNVVITNQTDWQTWWTIAVSCLPKWDSTWPWFDPGPIPEDSMRHGMGWPNGPIDPYGPVAPAINFDTSMVVAVTIEQEETPGRFIRVTEVKPNPDGGTVVQFVVTRPGPDCMILMMSKGDSATMYAPTTAVLVPKLLAEPVSWERVDTEMDCSWEPDPNTPLTLYYTDASCDLGPAGTIITDEARFEQWVEAALTCDLSRWRGRGDSSTVVIGDSGGQGWIDSVGPGEPGPMPPIWNGFDVDFSKHAVLILRAGEFTRWGGGIWLDEVKTAASGTTIRYTVMQPGDECPLVGDGGLVNPTVAIRVPLPVTAPVTWDRGVQSIPCDWDHPDDSTRVWPDSSL